MRSRPGPPHPKARPQTRLCLALSGAAGVLLPAAAFAGRPDTGGDLYDFEPTDVVEFVDSPSARVRVHYSAQGPNVTVLRDDDASSVPDLPEDVAAAGDAVLDAFEAAGFRLPLAESAVGLSALGGSDAFDFYLVDFGQGADGMFSVDRCRGGVCAGHMLVDNDFAEFDYASVSAAIRVLTSHETFHAVQAAYVEELAVWISEGTAVWAEKLFDPESQDFLSFAGAYLQDAGRSIDRPPLGPVPAFAYGSCLFWEYLTQRFGTPVLPALMDALAAGAEPLDAVETVLDAAGTDLAAVWTGFTEANLQTGIRAGETAFYPFANRLASIPAEGKGPEIAEDHRFYPLAASYWMLQHEGGPAYFAVAAADDPAGLVVSVHATTEAGRITETLATFEPTGGGVVELGDLPEGNYWMRGTYPQRAAQSRKVQFCLGGAGALPGCGLSAPDAGLPDVADLGPLPSVDAVPPGPDAEESAPDAAEEPADASVAEAGTTPDANESSHGAAGSAGGGCQSVAPGRGRLPWLVATAALVALGLRRRGRRDQ